MEHGYSNSHSAVECVIISYVIINVEWACWSCVEILYIGLNAVCRRGFNAAGLCNRTLCQKKKKEKKGSLGAVGGSFMGKVPRKFSLAQGEQGLSNAASGHDLCVWIHVAPEGRSDENTLTQTQSGRVFSCVFITNDSGKSEAIICRRFP